MVERAGDSGGGGGGLFYPRTNPTHGGSELIPNHIPKASLPNTNTLGTGLNMSLGGGPSIAVS